MRKFFVVLVFLLATADGLPAQSVLDSARVRITAPLVSRSRLVGTVVAVDSGVITLQDERAGRGVTNIPLSLVSFLEVSRGEITARNAAWRGMFKGAAVGVLVGGAAGATVGLSEHGGGRSDASPARITLRGAGAGLLVGALAGTILGSVAEERWEEVSVASVAFRPGSASVGITLSR